MGIDSRHGQPEVREHCVVYLSRSIPRTALWVALLLIALVVILALS